MSQALSHQPHFLWALWALILIIQNAAFTLVSRARNSGSVTRHAFAAIASNGVWFISQIFIVGGIMDILTGKFGWPMAVGTALFYTTFTVIGALAAHYFSLKTEKGKSSVGASKKYAQIPIEEWEAVKTLLNIGREGYEPLKTDTPRVGVANEPASLWHVELSKDASKISLRLIEEDFGHRVYLYRGGDGGSLVTCLTQRLVARQRGEEIMAAKIADLQKEGYGVDHDHMTVEV